MPENNESLYLAPKSTSITRKYKLIIAAVTLTLLILVALTAYFVLAYQASNSATDSTLEVRAESESGYVESGTNYVAMPRPFVFNVMEGERDRLVQIKVQLMVQNEDNEALARKHIPLLEGTLVSVFSAATAQQLRLPAGREQLRETALNALNDATTKLEGRTLIHAVLFTGFVLQ